MTDNRHEDAEQGSSADNRAPSLTQEQGHDDAGQPGYDTPGYGQPGYDTPGYGQPGHGQVEYQGDYEVAMRFQAGARAAQISMVYGVLGMFFGFLGLVFGPLGLSQAREAERMGHPAPGGRALSIIAIVFGSLVVAYILFLLFMIAGATSTL